jgi:glycosyltransferase involved in cell wall biosynthesis
MSKSENRVGAPGAGLPPLVTVVVPAYNEADILARNLAALEAYLRTLEPAYRFELVIVDDGSSDATGEIAEAFAAGRGDVVVLRHEINFRLGQTLRTAFGASRGDIVVVMDADLSYAPEHIGAMLARMRETRAKIVIASPYRKGGSVVGVPCLRRVLSKGANRFLCLMAPKDFFSDTLTNITGMVRAYDGEFIRGLSLWAMDVDVNPEIINKAKILRARIVEVPARLAWDESRRRGAARRGDSKLSLLRGTIQSLVSGYMFRPFHFFIAPGLLLFALSLYPLAWTIIHTVDQYGKLAGKGLSVDFRLSEAIAGAFQIAPHSFVVAGFALVVAIQLLSLGLLSLQKKRNYAQLFYLMSALSRDGRMSPKERAAAVDPLRNL